MKKYFNGLVQERHNSIANALELHLSYTKPLICEMCPGGMTAYSALCSWCQSLHNEICSSTEEEKPAGRDKNIQRQNQRLGM